MFYELRNLGQKDVREIKDAIAALPASVTILRLENLGYKTGAEITQIFAEIPPSITSLDLHDNNLGNKIPDELKQIFEAVPASITSLNLDSNQLSSRTGAELAQAFAALPWSVTCLDLSSNYLHNKTESELALIFAAVPRSVTSLHLRCNSLGHKTGAGLTQIFAAIPASISSLNLNLNNLDLRSGADLAQALALLPASITSLNLSFNGLKHKSSAELTLIFAALPTSLLSLDLRNNKLNAEQLDKIIKGTTATSVVLDGDITIHYPNEFFANQLKAETNLLLSSPKEVELKFDSIKLEVEITETLLKRLINLLEKQYDPLADLICGLLLEGRINTTADQIDNCSAYDDYMEKRTHDAISFYTKAAEDKAIKPIVEFVLWEMRALCPFDSVRQRLAQYDISLQTLSKSFSQISKFRPAEVSMPLYARLRLFKPSTEPDPSHEFKSAAKLGF